MTLRTYFAGLVNSLPTETRRLCFIMLVLNVGRVARLGNNIIQLYQSMLLARQVGAVGVCIESLRVFLFNPDFRQLVCSDGLVVTRRAFGKRYKVISDRFFGTDSFGGFEFDPDLSLVPGTFQDIQTIMGVSKSQCGISDYIHCHIRSGDIFVRKVPKYNYTQPPLAYYVRAVRDLLETGLYKGVKVVYETEHNPVVRELLGHACFGVPVVGQSSTLEEDVAELLTASAVVMGVGSFAPMICAVSGKARHAAVFREQPSMYQFPLPCYFLELFGTEVINYSDDGTYIPVNGWAICYPDTKQSFRQRKLVVDFPIERIRRV